MSSNTPELSWIRRHLKAIGAVALAFVFTPAICQGADAEPASELHYDRDIRPILSENCFSCHGFDSKSRQADLRLDTREGAIEGGAITPGEPTASSLIARIHSMQEDEVMPPPDSGRSLTKVQKDRLQRWIEQGAEYEQHWAFVAPRLVEPPKLDSALLPIDQFIRAKLASAGLTSSPPAEPATLIRRVSLDLTGLPPTPEQITEFEVAAATDFDSAYDALVERLLASPHYGERWARWWLDQARYADSNGYSIDSPREIWKYRDWVVESLNADMPFDQFTIEQIAGDLLPNATQDQRIATGFHRNTQINQEGGIDPEQFRIDSVFDRVATTGTVWLGLSIGCAQCHDHKFDPLTQKDFYQLFAFFNNQDEPTMKVYPPGVDSAALLTEQKELEQKFQALLTEHQVSLAEWEKALTDETREALAEPVKTAISVAHEKRSTSQKLMLLTASNLLPPDSPVMKWIERSASITMQLEQAVTTLVLAERSQPRKTTVFIKGDFTRPADEVLPGTPAALHKLDANGQPQTRLDLARWIIASDNPLTARVIVNRIWQQYFGRGLVETDNDFGFQGSSPSHPELLDWLAIKLREHQWSLKELHRTIVMSQTYRQSSVAKTASSEHDPLNLLLGRQNRLRLDAEIVRDVALVASGLFAPKLGGPPVFPPIPDGVMNQGQSRREWKVSRGEDRYRRGLYTFVYRVTPPPSLTVFDAPDGLSSCTRRLRSNTPLQALTLLNDASFFEFATALEKRIQQDGLAATFRRCTSRNATPDELQLLSQLDSLNMARALLNLDETINRE